MIVFSCMKKRILFIVIIVVAVFAVTGSSLLIKRSRTDLTYERPVELYSDAVVVLFMDFLNECNNKKVYAFLTEEYRNRTMIKAGWEEVSGIQCEKELRNRDFVLGKNEQDWEWYNNQLR